ncbi:hypothetical protein I6A93_15465 [Clostridioides difficile]|uniref:lanthionine synthetase LanC family protein n=1 Tax=Clostridioides difficile TaxID=1496 RepID=UPI0014416879|nr:lanthionine synthetase LanC family protein [Clostridioides difficile]MBH6949119.1 hypothetical protein [Clostridioides difficile]MCP8382607.1 hypothetical protein [Clostridioides difficile]NKN20631.1 hypothetical protein [Clostridioides difficile]HBG7747723.1 hypothetical protein [Clostridioides difficile]
MISNNTNIELKENYYKKVKVIIEWYISSIKQDYLNDYIPPFRYEDYLITISEFLSLSDDKIKGEYIEIGYSLAKGIKHKLEYDFKNYKNPSMFTGLGYTTFSIYLFNKKTGLLKNFLHSLNSLLLNECYNKVISLTINNDNRNTKDTDYDLIYGVSGVLYYLLEFEWCDKDTSKIIKLGEYLISLCFDYRYGNILIPRFHINSESFINEFDKAKFPNGCLNFGMAHGMIAPLVSITKLKQKIDNIKKIDIAIDRILNLYKVFVNTDKNYYRWPTQISIEDYLKKEFDVNDSQIATWCYGSMSIAHGLKHVFLNLKDNKSVNTYNNILKKLLTQNFEEYNLYTPILCHGHSSLLSIMISVYKETHERVYLYNLEKTLDEIFQLFDSSLRYGFKTFSDLETIENTSFLEGTSGIILSLISILSKESTYKKLLFLS